MRHGRSFRAAIPRVSAAIPVRGSNGRNVEDATVAVIVAVEVVRNAVDATVAETAGGRALNPAAAHPALAQAPAAGRRQALAAHQAIAGTSAGMGITEDTATRPRAVLNSFLKC